MNRSEPHSVYRRICTLRRSNFIKLWKISLPEFELRPLCFPCLNRKSLNIFSTFLCFLWIFPTIIIKILGSLQGTFYSVGLPLTMSPSIIHLNPSKRAPYTPTVDTITYLWQTSNPDPKVTEKSTWNLLPRRFFRGKRFREITSRFTTPGVLTCNLASVWYIYHK